MLHYLFMSPYRGGETCLVANQIQAFHYPFIEITRFNVLCIPCSCFFFERIFRRIRQVLFSLTHAIFKVPLYRSLSLSQSDENSFVIATRIFLNDTEFCIKNIRRCALFYPFYPYFSFLLHHHKCIFLFFSSFLETNEDCCEISRIY